MYLHVITEDNSRLSSELCLCEDVSTLIAAIKVVTNLVPYLNKPQVYTQQCAAVHQEISVGRVHTCSPRALGEQGTQLLAKALGGQAQHACQGLLASCCVQTCLPRVLGKQVCTPARHGSRQAGECACREPLSTSSIHTSSPRDPGKRVHNSLPRALGEQVHTCSPRAPVSWCVLAESSGGQVGQPACWAGTGTSLASRPSCYLHQTGDPVELLAKLVPALFQQAGRPARRAGAGYSLASRLT
jgi:hypothetical protein